jgi:hypothetical protein
MFHHAGHKNAPQPHDKELVTQAKRLVAQTFFGTLLKQMHDSPFQSKLLDGGKSGQTFSGMFDQHLVDRMAGGTKMKELVNSIANFIEKGAAAKNQKNPEKKAVLQRRLQKHSYGKKPNKFNRSPDVTTSLRA